MSRTSITQEPIRTGRKPIDAAKEAVGVLDLAERLCGDLRAVGSRYEACCPLPDHDDKTPSFNVYQETQSFYCFGCLCGGDVVDLYAAVNGYDRLDEAAGFLLLEFDHEVPQRPASWYRKQTRQQKIRARIEAERIEHIRLLVFRLIFTPWLEGLPESQQEQCGESAWMESRKIARMVYAERRGQ